MPNWVRLQIANNRGRVMVNMDNVTIMFPRNPGTKIHFASSTVEVIEELDDIISKTPEAQGRMAP